MSESVSAYVIRRLQVLNNCSNTLFGHLNSMIMFLCWLNIVCFGVASVHGFGVALPEYLVLPATFIGFYILDVFYISLMSNVRVSWDDYKMASKRMVLSNEMKLVIASVRPLGIQLGAFGFASCHTSLKFSAVSIDYMIMCILGMGIEI